MSEAEATEALLARLSYQASLRAGELAKRAAIKLPLAKVAKIALIFCLLVRRLHYKITLYNYYYDFNFFNCILVVYGKLHFSTCISKDRSRNGNSIIFNVWTIYINISGIFSIEPWRSFYIIKASCRTLEYMWNGK